MPTAALVVVAATYVFFAVISVVLTRIDLRFHRLPNAVVLPSYLIAGVLFALACALGAEWASLLRAAIAMAVLFAFYFLLRLISPGSMGGGDVKLAGLVGLFLGWVGWPAVIVGAFAAFLLGGVFSAILLATRRAGRRTAIPFGPWMLLGAWIGIVAGEWLGGLALGYG